MPRWKSVCSFWLCLARLTHRCHKRRFCSSFAKDRRAGSYWLYQARRRYGLCVELCRDVEPCPLTGQDMGHGEIATQHQLIAGRVAQQFNRRKSRKGAYWEDRYHATAVLQADGIWRDVVTY